MCGIAGVHDPSGAESHRELVAAMGQRLAHRGPDGDGLFVEGPVAFAHRRLSILDLATGAQPMESATGRSIITYNGEIYNFPELRCELEERGHRFRTRSDTEVVLALYEAEGVEGLDRLSGMYALALWDRREQRFVLARDPVGIKPLFVARKGGRLAFASELKALRPFGLGGLSAEAVNAYFLRQHVGGGRTIHSGARSLAAGERFVLEAGAERRRRQVMVPEEHASPSRAEAVERLDELLDASVRRHLLSDVPVGVFLSGGVDSSTLLALASRAGSEPRHAFAVGFGAEDELTEVGHARRAAELFGARFHELHVSPEEALAQLPSLIARMDQPLADYALLPTWIMSRQAAEHVKVVLSGDGADELFAGYRRHREPAAWDRLSAPLGGLPARWRMQRGPLPTPAIFDDRRRRRLLGERFIPGRFLEAERQLRRARHEGAAWGALNATLWGDLACWLVDDLLAKTDLMGMLASLEARVPYLDRELVTFAAALPFRLKVDGGRDKVLLRDVAARHLPVDLSERRKHGFTVPVGRWIAGPLQDTFREVVLDPGGPAAEWLDLGFVKRLLARHERRGTAGLVLWALLVFGWWLREHDS